MLAAPTAIWAPNKVEPITSEGSQTISVFDESGNGASTSFFTEFGFGNIADLIEELDARVPLSIARWHRHVNYCFPTERRRIVTGVELRTISSYRTSSGRM